jgi:hypothetical protein
MYFVQFVTSGTNTRSVQRTRIASSTRVTHAKATLIVFSQRSTVPTAIEGFANPASIRTTKLTATKN